jgi:DNA-binding CsgD family transcriptional regulator
MPLPVKLSDALVLDARLAAEVEQRSIAGQVEYWAKLGRIVDALIDGRTRGAVFQGKATRPLSELVAGIETSEGRARLKAHLESESFPHFEPHPTRRGVLARIEADGSRSIGRFVNREFVAEAGDPKDTEIESEAGAGRPELGSRGSALASHAAATAQLPPRERLVLELILMARSNREIASELGIEERTVEAYVGRLMRRAGVNTRQDFLAGWNKVREQMVMNSPLLQTRTKSGQTKIAAKA